MKKSLSRIGSRFLPPLLGRAWVTRSEVHLIRLGSVYGGWWVPVRLLKPDAVVFSAGAGEDISFDAALVERGLRVFVFDPTPRAIRYVREHGPMSARFTFIPEGIWREKATKRFYAPADPAHVSHSILNLQRTESYFDAPVDTLSAFAVELGVHEVDILKLDIEGAELVVVEAMIAAAMFPQCICVEFDRPCHVRDINAVRLMLRACDYNLLKIERWNYTFVRHDPRV